MMIVCIGFGLYWVLSNLFDHYIQSSVQFSSVQFYVFVTLMLVGVWLGLLWVLFYFFDHYIQSSVQFSSAQFSSVLSLSLFSFII